MKLKRIQNKVFDETRLKFAKLPLKKNQSQWNIAV